MELHSYKWPSLVVIYQRVWERVVAFVGRAGVLIFSTTILVWAAGYFPGNHEPLDAATTTLERLQVKKAELLKAKETDLDKNQFSQIETKLSEVGSELDSIQTNVNSMRSHLIETSFLGMAGHGIEPFVRPLGWDWKIGVSVIASFPAREVIIATLGTIYSLGTGENEKSDGLQSQMQNAVGADGRPVFSLGTAMSIMVFFALCAQCSATLMTIRRETNSWRWPIFSFVYMTVLAYIGAWITYQIFHAWG